MYPKSASFRPGKIITLLDLIPGRVYFAFCVITLKTYVYHRLIPEKYTGLDMQTKKSPAALAPRASFMHGMRLAIPIVLGYIPVGFTFGVLASKAGLSPLEAGLMSLLVFAGSGQLIAVNLMLAALAPANIIMTTFVVNARHLLMSAAMLPFLGKWSKKKQMVYCAEMTDETFALNIGRFAEKGVDQYEAFGIHLTAHSAWVLGGILGALFGGQIADLRPYGLDYALAGMFIALLVPHLKIPRHLAAALVSAALSIILYLCGVEQWNVLIATIAAATVCMFLPLPNNANEKGGKA